VQIRHDDSIRLARLSLLASIFGYFRGSVAREGA
jgi:hypothetical protein